MSNAAQRARAELFGSRLRRLRKERGRTIGDIAAFAGLRPGYIEKIERGYSAPPSQRAIADCSRAIGADADVLFAVSDKLPLDLENAIKCRPLLLQLVRLAQTWSQDELREFLLAHGVCPSKIEACDVERPDIKNDERLCRREPISKELKQHILRLDNHECVYCSSTKFLEIDHIYPFSHGGTNEIDNLVVCCDACNKKKSNNTKPPVRVFGRFREEVEA
ncbi:helix-turn-helix domain-containing protein [bacterium]|nr:MAG: helix-turn-helix domain-containing protein [bacterium]